MSIWLDRVNYYRGLANLPDVSEDLNLSAGDNLAAEYMVLNNTITHTEVPGNPGYNTPAGTTAAAQSDIAVYYTALPPQTQMVDEWMTGAFHGSNMLDPRLQTVGFGTYQNLTALGYKSATALNVEGGKTGASGFPIYWPGNNKTVSLTSYSMYGTEWPDARASCAGYTSPGLPITLQLGPGNVESSSTPGTSGVTSFSLMQGSTSLAVCEIDEFTYTNTQDANGQSWGKSVLSGQGTIVLLPQQALAPGPYTARITVNGTSYTWTFNIASAPAVPTVSAISQSSGPVTGGISLTITGTGFRGAYGVYFGNTSVPATSFTVDSDNQITVTSSPPATASGVVDITVANPSGLSTTSSADQFTYLGALQFCCVDTAGTLWYAAYPVSGGSWPLTFGQLSAQKSTDSTSLQFTEIAGAMVGTDLHICGIDITGGLWHAIYSASGPLSFDQVSVQSPGNQRYTKLSCAGTPAGSLHICTIDANGVIYHDVHTSTSPSWSLAFTDNVNQLSNAGAMTFQDIACATIQEDLHIAAVVTDLQRNSSILQYTRCTVANGTSTWLSPFVDALGWGNPTTPAPRIWAIGCAALGGILHVYLGAFYGPNIPIWHTSSAVTVANNTWQPVETDPTSSPGQIDANNLHVSCTSWGNNIHIAYGFLWSPEIIYQGSPPTPATQSLYHTVYSPSQGGWSPTNDTVLTQNKTGNYLSKVSIVGG